MKGTRTWRAHLVWGLALLALAAVPAWAAENVQSGADFWHTTTGFTFTSFVGEPIPAGFFCPGSKALTSTINLRGVPLATEPAGALGETDTIVRRLDKATFNEKGEATTRIQLMALSLAGLKPIDTGCGLYNVTASLGGEQPVTEMKIVRTSDNGGYYVAPLELNVKVVFTPVSGKGDRRELTHKVSLGPGTESVWAYAKGAAAKVAVRRAGMVKVDTNGDRVADTLVPAASNFVAGVDPAAFSAGTGTAIEYCKDQSCHCAKFSKDPYVANYYCDHLHCVDVLVDCSKPVDKVRYGPIPEDPTTDPSTPVIDANGVSKNN
jgi:hypothetical protein